MRCKFCKGDLPEHAIFCCWCGERQIKERKKKDDVSVPKPEKHGQMWRIRLRRENVIITEETEEACILKAKSYRAGYLTDHKCKPRQTVKQVVNKFIEDHSNTLSPSTIKAYRGYYKNYFQEVENEDALSVPWQKRMNELASRLSAKSVDNIWKLMLASIHYAELDPPNVKLPQISTKDMPFLDYQQIQIFLNEIRDKPVELPALLALHSLRRSEIMALTMESIDRRNNLIRVRGARVLGDDGLVMKEANKTQGSARDVPIMIPRLLEILPEDCDGYLITCNNNTIMKQVNSVCRSAGLPQVGVHGLRRSFASLAYHLNWDERTVMLVGGWSSLEVAHRYYIKLAHDDINRQTDSMKEFYKAKEGTP